MGALDSPSKLFQWIGDHVEEIAAERRPQLVDMNIGGIGHVSWVEANMDHISFVPVTDWLLKSRQLG